MAHVTFAERNDETASHGVVQAEDNVSPFISPVTAVSLATSAAASSAVHMTAHGARRPPHFVPLAVLFAKPFTKNPNKRCLSRVTFSLQAASVEQVPAAARAVLTVVFPARSLPNCTARLRRYCNSFRPERFPGLEELSATDLARWDYKYFALCIPHCYWSEMISRWERGRAERPLPTSSRGLAKTLTCLITELSTSQD